MAEKTKPDMPICPGCSKDLRPRTYEEIIDELMNEHGMTRFQASIAHFPRVGALGSWWCESCEREYEGYSLLSQAMSVKPVEKADG